MISQIKSLESRVREGEPASSAVSQHDMIELQEKAVAVAAQVGFCAESII